MQRKSNIKEKKKSPKDNSLFNKNHALILGIVFITLFVYKNVVNSEFLNWDDPDMVTQNKQVLTGISLQNTIDIFISSNSVNEYQPLTTLVYNITHALFGFNSSAFHFVNLLFHIFNTILVYLLVKTWFKKSGFALIISLLFAIHPLNVEPIAWVSTLNYALFTSFFLLALIYYSKYLIHDYKIKYLLYVMCFFVLSLLAKSSAVVFPLVLFSLDFLYQRKFKIALFLDKLPFFALSIAFGLLAMSFRANILDTLTIKIHPLSDRLIFALYSSSLYVVKILFPVNLKIVYSYPELQNSFFPLEYYLQPLLLISVFLILFFVLKEHRKMLLFATSFFLANIAIVVHIIPFYHVGVIAERYVYIAAIGLFVFIVHLYFAMINKYPSYKNTLRTFAIIYLGFFTVTSFIRVSVWKDDFTLYADLIDKNPNEAIAYINRGDVKNNIGDLTGAIQDFDRAIELNPKNPNSLHNRSIIKNKLGDHYGAIEDCNKALELKPDFADAFYNRGFAKEEIGDTQGAISDYNNAIKTNPLYVQAYNNRGIIFSQMQLYDKAIDDFKKAIVIDEDFSDTYINKGYTYIKMNNFKKACELFRKAREKGDKTAVEMIDTFCK